MTCIIDQIKACIIAWLLLLSLGCTAVYQAERVVIADGVFWQLQPADALDKINQQTVLITANYQNNAQQLLVTTEFRENVMHQVAISLQGLPLYELSLDNSGMVTYQQYIPSSIKPKYILSDMQLVHLPLNHLNAMLTGAIVTETTTETGRQRMVFQGQKIIMTIDYQASGITMVHHQRNYQLTIKEVE
ncbi:DUF3261 domain-containing protein [Thalassotalea sp. PLHSN55]|uniref:DUF3261 domain-containing protein n=1 Tax=Thalassotalea sp. PLHSN55 TaxID=3435888 RepID=UPI003F85EA40